MLTRAVAPVEKIISNIEQRVLRTLRPFKRKQPSKRNGAGNQPWIGLAISGGVDSMALAAVCSNLHTLDSEFRGAFRGFIVDHGVREGSGEEAAKVAAELERIGISAQILKLAWGEQDPRTTTNFETLARRLRYRALGSACWDARIRRLLVAHHADDQAETVLSRIVTGYMGSGLQGMRKESRIPECEGMYGVDASGAIPSYHMHGRLQQPFGGRIEYGGVNLYRPLLPFKKADLIALCQAKRVQWVEDHTNKDKTLTQRNTIRHLMGNEALPMALSAKSVHEMAAQSRKEFNKVEQEAKRLFNVMKIDLYVHAGKAVVPIPRSTDKTFQIPDRSQEENYHIKATLLRNLLLLVSPCSDIALQDLDQAMDLVFPERAPSQVVDSHNPTSVQIAGVNLLLRHILSKKSKTLGQELILTRAIPTNRETRQFIPIPSADRSTGLTPWILWDSRYWLRLRVDPTENVSYDVRFFTEALFIELRNKGVHFPAFIRVPQADETTVPVIVGCRNGEPILAALKSPGENGRTVWASGDDIYATFLLREIECRYKHVVFGKTTNHCAPSPKGQVPRKALCQSPSASAEDARASDLLEIFDDVSTTSARSNNTGSFFSDEGSLAWLALAPKSEHPSAHMPWSDAPWPERKAVDDNSKDTDVMDMLLGTSTTGSRFETARRNKHQRSKQENR